MSKEIKDTIEEFKMRNGNATFTQKDLLMYLVERVDNLPCMEHMGDIKGIEGDIKNLHHLLKDWKWYAGVIVSIMIAFTCAINAI